MINVDLNRVIEILAGKIGRLEKENAMAAAALEVMNARLTELEAKD